MLDDDVESYIEAESGRFERSERDTLFLGVVNRACKLVKDEEESGEPHLNMLSSV